MEDVKRTRFKDAEWLKFKDTVTIVGVGGIGSWVALLLDKIGFKAFYYDMDTLEEINLGSQFYSDNYYGSYKVNAMNSTLGLLDTNRTESEVSNVRFTKKLVQDYDLDINYLLCCVDNMKTRKEAFEAWLDKRVADNWQTPGLFIDGRMEAEQIDVFVVKDAETAERYKEHLFVDSDVPDAPCSFKSTPQTGALIASRIVGALVNYVSNAVTESNLRSVPFHVMEATSLFFINIEE